MFSAVVKNKSKEHFENAINTLSLHFPVGNGDSTRAQTDVDRRHRHSEQYLPIGAEIQTTHQEVQP